MLTAKVVKKTLFFKKPAITSRNVLREKIVYLLLLKDDGLNKIGLGECTFIPGLSLDNPHDYEDKLNWVTKNIEKRKNYLMKELTDYPSLKFGVEMAFAALNEEDEAGIIYPSPWTKGDQPLIINGLVWMGDYLALKQQVKRLLKKSFRCLKLKVGALDFEEELRLVEFIRGESPEIILRLDANGAWGKGELSASKMKKLLHRLEKLKNLNVHSLEQPVESNNLTFLHKVLQESPLPIALDEELLGKPSYELKEQLLVRVSPDYLVLKPSLLGGVHQAEDWIKLASRRGIKWWVTSALESSWGLNYLAQWTASLASSEIQGLGTGHLYHNNFPSALKLAGDKLWFEAARNEQIKQGLNDFFLKTKEP